MSLRRYSQHRSAPMQQRQYKSVGTVTRSVCGTVFSNFVLSKYQYAVCSCSPRRECTPALQLVTCGAVYSHTVALQFLILRVVIDTEWQTYRHRATIIASAGAIPSHSHHRRDVSPAACTHAQCGKHYIRWLWCVPRRRADWTVHGRLGRIVDMGRTRPRPRRAWTVAIYDHQAPYWSSPITTIISPGTCWY